MNADQKANQELITFLLSMTPEETERALSRLDNPEWLKAHGFDPDNQKNLGLLRMLLQFTIH